MSENLVIVESPAKAKTLSKYFGKGFSVLASYGHVRDLLPKSGAVDPEHDFEMHYELIEKNEKRVADIRKALKSAKNLYLALDPDREGEAIAWHLYEIFHAAKALKNKKIHRIAFHEITKNAIQEALKHPRDIDMNLVNAQQARRALDYLVGFNLSPLLWKKVRRGLSAGRVQSPALRLIVEREKEIEAFKSQEYWTISADCLAKKQNFAARLIEYHQEKIEQFTIQNEETAKKIQADLLSESQQEARVLKIEKKARKKNPSPPFITSTLQQEAVKKLGFSAKKAMMIAQQLYEGIDIGSGPIGLITYMRTDSVTLAQEAIQSLRAFIEKEFGADSLPESPRVYKTKSKNAQEAHEAIRPTDVLHTPKAIKSYLDPSQFKLYQLIWQRTVACQMVAADIETVSVDLSCGEKNRLRATGSTIVNPGFMSVYEEINDEGKAEDETHLLPALSEGDTVQLKTIDCYQHFTEPPPRYSEATLVKALEEHGIGRPSTYASIISTLQNRGYAELQQKRFHPTDVGVIVNRFLTEYFDQYVDYGFTAELEDGLDEIARGEKQWVPLLKGFWKPFKKKVDLIDEKVKRSDVTQEAIDEKCPKCEKPLVIRLGRAGRFIGCTAYPECDYTRNIDSENAKVEEAQAKLIEGRACPQCGSHLQIRRGRFGAFIGCSGYPTCKYIEPLEKPKDTGVLCPECHKGQMLTRKSRYGKPFYSCSRYPDCKYAVWYEPVDEQCPKCKWPMLMLKTTKRYGEQKVCPQKNCGYVKTVFTKKQEDSED